MTDIHLYNRFHLGDQLYHMHFISKYVKQFPEYRFFNYMLPEYIEESNIHRHPGTEENIINLALDQRPSDAEDYWINRDAYYEKWIQDAGQFGHVDFDIFYVNFYKFLFTQLKLPLPSWKKEDSLFDHPIISQGTKKTENLNFDFLIINSVKRWGEWRNNPKDFDTLVNTLLTFGHTVVTSGPSDTKSHSTMYDYGMNLLELGNLSSKCKYVIGHHTAPWLFTFNKESIQKLNFSICLQNRGLSYSPEHVYPVRHNFDEIYQILNRENLLKH